MNTGKQDFKDIQGKYPKKKPKIDKTRIKIKINPDHKDQQSWGKGIENTQDKRGPEERRNQRCKGPYHRKPKSTTREENKTRQNKKGR